MIIYLIAIWAILAGIAGIAGGFRMKSVPGSGWGWFLAWGILALIFGIALIANPAAGILSILWLVAIWAIMAGIVFIVASFFVQQGRQHDRRTIPRTEQARPAVRLAQHYCRCSPPDEERAMTIRYTSRRPGPDRGGADRVPERLHHRGWHAARRRVGRDGVSTGMLQNTVDLVAKARAAGATIVHTPISFVAGYGEISAQPYGILAGVVDSNSFVKGTWGAEIVDDMTPEPGDIVIEGKRGFDAFASTNLDFILRSKGITTIALGGFLTNCCVESTMRTGYEKGYQVYTLTDCLAATSHEEHDNAISKDYPMFSRPVTSTDFVAALDGSALADSSRGTDCQHAHTKARRRRSGSAAIPRGLTRIPVTLLTVGLLLLAGMLTGTLFAPADPTDRAITSLEFGLPAFREGRIWTLFTGAVTFTEPEFYLFVGVLLAVGLGSVRTPGRLTAGGLRPGGHPFGGDRHSGAAALAVRRQRAGPGPRRWAASSTPACPRAVSGSRRRRRH